MKYFLPLFTVLAVPLAAQQVNPNQIQPSGTPFYVLTTIGGQAIWAPAAAGACGSNEIPCLNTPNTWTTGIQLFQSSGLTNVPMVIQGAGGGVGTPNYVQGSLNGDSTPFQHCTQTLNGVNAGDIIIAISGSDHDGIPATATDDQGDTFTQIATTNGEGTILIAPNVHGGNTTISMAGLNNVNSCAVMEYSGVALANPLDQVSMTTGSGSSVTTGPVTTTNPTDVIISFVYPPNGTVGPTPTGYTLGLFGPEGFGLQQFASAFKNVSSTGTYTADWSWQTPDGFTYGVIALKAGGSLYQTSDLLQFQDSTGTVRSSVNAEGQFVLPENAGNIASGPALAYNPSSNCPEFFNTGDSTWTSLCGAGGVTSINATSGAFTFNFSAGAGSCSGTTCTFTGSGSGGGSVTNFLAPTGSWPSWLVPSVATSTTTPTLSVTPSTIPVSAGGTGTTTPTLTAGANISITGTWPNQTITGTGGGGSVGPGTGGTYPIFSGTGVSTTIGNGHLNETTSPGFVTSTIPFAVNDGSSNGGTAIFTEGTCTGGSSGQDLLCADSTAHRWRVSNNAGSLATVATLSDLASSSAFGVAKCDGTTITCSGGVFTATGGGGGSGTVTNFTSGNLSPLFTTSVATSTTTPALSFSLSNAPAFSVFGNFSNSTAAPSFNASGGGTTNFLRADGTWSVPPGSAVTSVSNTDNTLTVAPTTGAVHASLNLANANTWTAGQIMPSLTTNGTNNGALTLTSNGSLPALPGGGSIQVTTPNSVSAYQMELPAGQPASNQTYLNCTAANPTVCSFTGIFLGPPVAYASLPSASSAGSGNARLINDSTSYTPGPCVGGGGDVMIAVSDGTNWTCH